MKKIASLMLLIFFTGCSDDEPIPPTNPDPTPTTGTFVFWSTTLLTHDGRLKIVIDEKESFITINQTNEPDCSTVSGCAFFSLNGGTYSYTASDKFGIVENGIVNVINGQCKTKHVE